MSEDTKKFNIQQDLLFGMSYKNTVSGETRPYAAQWLEVSVAVLPGLQNRSHALLQRDRRDFTATSRRVGITEVVE